MLPGCCRVRGGSAEPKEAKTRWWSTEEARDRGCPRREEPQSGWQEPRFDAGEAPPALHARSSLSTHTRRRTLPRRPRATGGPADAEPRAPGCDALGRAEVKSAHWLILREGVAATQQTGPEIDHCSEWVLSHQTAGRGFESGGCGNGVFSETELPSPHF